MAELTEKQKEIRRKAVKDYRKRVETIRSMLPIGTKERIKNLTGKSCNAFIKELVLKELDKLERKNAKEKINEQNNENQWK